MAIPNDSRRREFLLGMRASMRLGFGQNWLPGMPSNSRLHYLIAHLARQERKSRYLRRRRTHPLGAKRSRVRTPPGHRRGRSTHRHVRAANTSDVRDGLGA